MTLPELKQLDKIIQLCRKRGVKTIKIDNVELTLSEDAPQTNYKRRKASKDEKDTENSLLDDTLEPAQLTEDQLLFWSSGVNQEEPGNT